MPVDVLGRASELEAIERLLDSLDQGAASLLLEGEPGIGKTTLVLAGIEMARQREMPVLSCSGASAETRLAYAGLADLLRGLEERAFDHLPGPQRKALDAALLRAKSEVPSDP